jgi:hypothetical protein
VEEAVVWLDQLLLQVEMAVEVVQEDLENLEIQLQLLYGQLPL